MYGCDRSRARDVVRVRRCWCPGRRRGGSRGGSVLRRDRSDGKLQLRRVIGPLSGRRLNLVIRAGGRRRAHRTRFPVDRRQREFAILQAGNQRINSYRDDDCQNRGAREQPVFEALRPGPNLRPAVRRRQIEPTEAPQKFPFLAPTLAFALKRKRGGLRKVKTTTFVSHRQPQIHSSAISTINSLTIP